ncbi:hypothetical protein BH11BAC6_BH11BAC6_17590 [soil metagenome]
MKNVTGVKWSKTLCGWTVPDTPENRKQCKLRQKDLPAAMPPANKTTKAALLYISADNNLQMQQFLQQLQLKAYSPNTIRTYSNEFAQLLQVLGKLPAQQLQPHQLQRYLLVSNKDLRNILSPLEDIAGLLK